MPHHHSDSCLSLNSETDHHILLVLSVHACVEIHASMAARFIIRTSTSREEKQAAYNNNNATFGVIRKNYKDAENDIPSYSL